MPPAEKPTAEQLAAADAAEEALAAEALAEMAPLKASAAEPEPKKATAAERNEELADEAMKERVAAYKATYPSLSEEDIYEALGISRDELQEANRKNTLKLLIAAEKARLRREEGLTVGASVLDEMQEFVVDCQEWQSPIIINGERFMRNGKYTKPRHIMNVILEMCDRGRRAERDRLGEKWDDFYRRPYETQISAVKGVQNAPRARAA